MRFQTIAAALTSASLASARIVGIAAPSQLAPNTPYQLTILTENYIQTVADISVAWGFNVAGYSYSLGAFPTSAYLGPSQSNVLHNITLDAIVPDGLDAWQGKDVVLTAGVYSLYGVSGEATVTGFNVTVRIADTTKNDSLVTSQGQGWVENGN